MKKLVNFLIEKNKTISFMESCTGGFLANCVTNVEDASNVFKYGAVTYSNDFKIKMGVSSSTIDKYSVYSKEVAMEMSKAISFFSNSNYGVGVTGKLNKSDKNNLYGDDNIVYISIYDRDSDKYIVDSYVVTKKNRNENKQIIVDKFIEMFSLYFD